MELATLALIFASATQTFNLPEGLLSSVCYVESNHAIHSVHVHDGNSDSLGICQVKLDTAKSLGFKGNSKQLLKPNINIYYAAKYLRFQLDRYSGDIHSAVSAYNSGSCKLNSRGLIKNRKYVHRVMLAWEEGR